MANVTAINHDNVLLGGDIIVMRAKEKLNNIFFAYYLSNYKKYEIASRAQGITIVHLYFNTIKDLYIDFPLEKEQTKIADFLSSIDSKIEKVATQLQHTQQFKKGLLQQLFV
ncbi:restriction endonuclease subunit S [Galbibacter orientalis]|uniref:restriction endonuclease subunit S n=1 Tax=Galbibacter orientalis TaxID=453852 RepID=UPI0006813C19|nr:restriction endonuclease subunit S [Galbibacter orientalis]